MPLSAPAKRFRFERHSKTLSQRIMTTHRLLIAIEHALPNWPLVDHRKESLGALRLMLYYWILARQVKRAVPISRQALQEIHSALSGSSPERQRMGRSGWGIRGLDIETKSATFEVNTSSILLNDLSPPTRSAHGMASTIAIPPWAGYAWVGGNI